MEENLITWNVVNWVTILLMAALGFLIFAALAQVFHKIRGTNSNATPGTGVGAMGS